MKKWTAKVRNRECEILEKARKIERAAVAELKKALALIK